MNKNNDTTKDIDFYNKIHNNIYFVVVIGNLPMLYQYILF